jgi:uncharacterized membrane protein YphA (DoxX/SURF4 family)
MNSRSLHTDDQHPGGVHTAAEVTTLALRIGLGAFFCLTGISKLFILNGFSAAIRQLVPVSEPFAVFLATFIIGCEILPGVGLLLNKAPRISTVMLGGLVSLFLYIHAIAVVSQRTFTCHCFGVIPISLSNSGEFILNLFLLDVLFIFYYRSGLVRRPALEKKRWAPIVMTLLILYGQISTASYILDREVTESSVDIQKVNAFLSARNQDAESSRPSRLLVLLRLSDFNCPPCFEDFIGFSRLMQYYVGDTPGDRRLIGLVEQSGSIVDTCTLKAWCTANDVPFPVLLVPDSVFQHFNIAKSCVVQQRPYGKVRYVYLFPGDESGRKKLLTALIE